MPEALNQVRNFRFDEMAIQVKDKVDNPAEADVDRYVGLEHIDPGSLKITRWGETTDVQSSKLVFKAGDIIFGKRRAYQRKLAVADFDGICSAHAMVLRPKTDVVLEEFLPFFMQSDAFMNRAVKISVGGLSPTINWRDLAKEEFALPPLEEQRRIGEVLQSVEGCLSSTYTALNAAYSALRSLLLSYLPEVSMDLAHWPIARFGDHVEIVDPNPSHRYPNYDDNGVPLVATQDFEGRDEYVFDKCKRVPRDVFEQQLARCRFDRDDVVFARKGILGSARKYGSKEKAFSHTIVVMKPRGESVDPDFLLWLVRSDSFMFQINRNMNSNSGVPTLGVKTLEDLQVWLPPKDEQSNIAQHTRAIDKAAQECEERRNQLEALKRVFLMQLSQGGRSA